MALSNRTPIATKDIIAMLRDSLLLIGLAVFAIFLVGWPEKIGEHFKKAGISKIGGIEFSKEDVIALDSAKVKLMENSQLLYNQLRSDSIFLSSLIAEIPDHSRAIDSVVRQIGMVQAKALGAQQAANKIIASKPELAKAVQDVQEDANEGGQWGVVFGADVKLEGALYEKQRAGPLNGLSRITIYSRHNSFRSVVVCSTRDSAEAILVKARQRRPDAYIVPMNTWCPHASDNGNYKTCLLP